MTGESILTFGENGVVDLRQGLERNGELPTRVQSNTPGSIFEDIIIMGSAPGEGFLSGPGHIRAFNVVTGELEWIFRTIPQPGEFGYETWPEDAYKYVEGVNVWSEITIDEERGIVYLPLGSPTYDYYGADRKGANLFATSLVALDARTGERIWHYQTIHHDIWDYDLPSAPQLMTVNRDGKEIDAVVITTKQGLIFSFDRETGEPIFPIEERPVPPSRLPGEEAWPTQPFPTKPSVPATKQKMTVEDLSDIFLTPEEKEEWIERLNKSQTGLYVPLDTIESANTPGALGGTNLGNTASNPENGILYVQSHVFPSFYQLKLQLPPTEEDLEANQRAAANLVQIEDGRKVYVANCQVCHGADQTGSGAAPAINNITPGINFGRLKEVVTVGIGRMSPLAHTTDEQIGDLLTYFNQSNSPRSRFFRQQADPGMPEGPVVASGGAPREQAQASSGFGGFGQYLEYPEGVEGPPQRYTTGYGLDFPYIMKPPWSYIMAYDMNSGELLWKRPLGQDSLASAMGFEGTGVPLGASRQSMIVTSNGILFSTAKDGYFYAFDAENGEVLWKGKLPMGTEGLPYEYGGKQYLVVNATTPLTWGSGSKQGGFGSSNPRGVGGYVVFSLPE